MSVLLCAEMRTALATAQESPHLLDVRMVERWRRRGHEALRVVARFGEAACFDEQDREVVHGVEFSVVARHGTLPTLDGVALPPRACEDDAEGRIRLCEIRIGVERLPREGLGCFELAIPVGSVSCSLGPSERDRCQVLVRKPVGRIERQYALEGSDGVLILAGV